MKLKVYSLARLHKLNSRIYLPLDYYITQEEQQNKISTSPIVQYEGRTFYQDTVNARSHRLSLAYFLCDYLFFTNDPNFSDEFKAEFRRIIKRFEKIPDVVKDYEEVCYSWEDIREFINNLGKKGRLANLIKEKEEKLRTTNS